MARAHIISNKNIAAGYSLIELRVVKAERLRPTIEPGHFMMLHIPGQIDPLLPRPFAIFDFRTVGANDELRVLYKVLGRQTKLLEKMKTGEELDVLYPLGQPVRDPLVRSESIDFIAGGVGLSGLFLGIKQFKSKRKRLFFGGRSKTDIVLVDDVKALGCEVYTATLDGSSGEKGTVLDLYKKMADKNTPIFVCGPGAMLKAVGFFARDQKIECLLSLEERMGCGVGLCLGCVVQRKNEEGYGPSICCREGPVYNARDLNLEALG